MALGDRGSAWRCLLVWVAATAVAGLGSVCSAATARPTWTAARSGALGSLALDSALTALAATALLGCCVWMWVSATATVLEAASGQPWRPTPWGVPGGVRRVVLAACGVALVGGLSSPAGAVGAEHSRHHGLAGLPLPDRATSPDRHRPEADLGRPRAGPGARSVVVSTGDSLWSIAVSALPAGASAPRVTARWRAIYRVNRAVIGPDPDLLEPGQRLRLPRKEAS